MIDPSIDIGKELIAKGRRHGIDIVPMLGRSSPEEIIELVQMFDRLDELPDDMKLPGVIGGNDTLDPAKGIEFGEDEADLQNYTDEEIADFQRDGDNASKTLRRKRQAVRDALLEGELRSPDLAVRNAAIARLRKLRGLEDEEYGPGLPNEDEPPRDYTSRDADGNPIRRTEGTATGAVIKQMAVRKEKERGRRIKGFTNKRYNPETGSWEYFTPEQNRRDIIADDVYYPGQELDAPMFTDDLQFGDMNQPGGLAGSKTQNEIYNQLTAVIGSGKLQGQELDDALRLQYQMAIDIYPQFELDAARAEAAETMRQDRDGLATEEIERRARLEVNRNNQEQGLDFYRSSEDLEDKQGRIRRNLPERRVVPVAGASSPIDSLDQMKSRIASIRSNPVAAIANQLKAEAEAERIAVSGVAAQTPLGTPINLGGNVFIERSDDVLSRLGEISAEGFGKASRPDLFKGEQLARAMSTAFALPGNDGFVDSRGLPIGAQGPEPGADFVPAAGDNRILRQWVMNQMVENDDPNKVMPIPVDIGTELGRLNEGLRTLKVGGMPLELDPRGIRSMSDLEQVIGSYLDMKAAAGEPIRVGVGGQQMTVENPGVGDVLTQMRIRPGNQQAATARALFQLENANLSSVDQARKELFREGVKLEIDRPVLSGRQFNAFANKQQTSDDDPSVRRVKASPVVDPGARIAKITPGEKAPKDAAVKKAKDAIAALTGSAPQTDGPLSPDELNDAQMPFKGAVAGEAAAPVGFIRGDRRNMSHSQRIKVMGPKNAAKAEGILRRHVAAEGRRRRRPDPMDVARNPEQYGTVQPSNVAMRNAEADARIKHIKADQFNQDKEVAALRSKAGRREVIQQGKGFVSPEVDLSSAVGQSFAPRSMEAAAQGVASPSVATSAITSPSPDPIPLAARGGWVSKQLPPGNRGGDLAIREAASIRRNSGGSLVDNRVEKVNIQVDSPPPSTPTPSAPPPTPNPRQEKSPADNIIKRESTSRAGKRSTPSGISSRNRLIRDIIGTTAAGAGSVALGAAIGSAYSKNQKQEEAQY